MHSPPIAILPYQIQRFSVFQPSQPVNSGPIGDSLARVSMISVIDFTFKLTPGSAILMSMLSLLSALGLSKKG